LSVQVERYVFRIRDGKVGKVDKLAVEVTFTDFNSDFWPAFDIVVFIVEKSVHKFKLAINCMSFIKVALTSTT